MTTPPPIRRIVILNLEATYRMLLGFLRRELNDPSLSWGDAQPLFNDLVCLCRDQQQTHLETLNQYARVLEAHGVFGGPPFWNLDGFVDQFQSQLLNELEDWLSDDIHTLHHLRPHRDAVVTAYIT